MSAFLCLVRQLGFWEVHGSGEWRDVGDAVEDERVLD